MTAHIGAEPLCCVANFNIKFSIALADPSLYDCPLIGCSDGFESLTGYAKSEVVGRNCRFLNQDMPMEPQTRQALCSAITTGAEFTGILSNVRKNGERFRNILRLISIAVNGHRYIIGIQGDVTDVDLDLTNASHLDGLQATAEHFFSTDVDAWVQTQAHEFGSRFPTPSAEMIKNSTLEQYKEADKNVMQIAGHTVHSKNTFLHVMNTSIAEDAECNLKKSASDPFLANCSTESASEQFLVNCSSGSSDPTEDSTKTYPSQSDSGERNASTDTSNGSQSSMSSSDAGCQASAELKSAGSASHPDKCKECLFYFFGSKGCVKGSDCRFCHEFHPRKNLRKHRRLLKRLAVVSNIPIPEENVADGTVCPGADPPAFTSGSEDEKIVFSRPPPSIHGDSSASAESSTASPMPMNISAVMSLRYMTHSRELQEDKLTLFAGQEVHVPANVEMDSATQKALQHLLSFSVDPPLQHGLSLDAHSGLISGVAREVQSCKLHMVTVSTAGTGPHGLRLGLVPLCRTPLRIRVVDLKACKASWVRELDGDGEERILVEFRVPSNSDGLRPEQPVSIS